MYIFISTPPSPPFFSSHSPLRCYFCRNPNLCLRFFCCRRRRGKEDLRATDLVSLIVERSTATSDWDVIWSRFACLLNRTAFFHSHWFRITIIVVIVVKGKVRDSLIANQSWSSKVTEVIWQIENWAGCEKTALLCYQYRCCCCCFWAFAYTFTNA